MDYVVIAGINANLQLEGGVIAPGGPEKWKIKAQSLISFENGCYDRRPTTLTFIYCTRILHRFHILVWYSNDVKFDSVSINSPALSPNTDGIHIEDSKMFQSSTLLSSWYISISIFSSMILSIK
ncbi:hypothetical protein F8388_027039 [Cannabis sativa]|uniref:Polygalacturonase n=1 Tax=Cannabis sativa TaxID=3483 RepID=A0A7J6FNS2_CANSA|nr:hypothetical protein F8388_027039 [Cannabis sativa]